MNTKNKSISGTTASVVIHKHFTSAQGRTQTRTLQALSGRSSCVRCRCRLRFRLVTKLLLRYQHVWSRMLTRHGDMNGTSRCSCTSDRVQWCRISLAFLVVSPMHALSACTRPSDSSELKGSGLRLTIYTVHRISARVYGGKPAHSQQL